MSEATVTGPAERVETIDLATVPGFKIPDAETLEAVLQDMNEDGKHPVLIGFDFLGQRFLAYLFEHAGDEVYPAVITDDPHGGGFDYGDVGRCEDCGAFERRQLAVLHYPLMVL